jgi:hypothetical protein
MAPHAVFILSSSPSLSLLSYFVPFFCRSAATKCLLLCRFLSAAPAAAFGWRERIECALISTRDGVARGEQVWIDAEAD